MTSVPLPPPRRESGLGRVRWFLAGLGVLFTVAFAVLSASPYFYIKSRVGKRDAEVVRLRALGIPTNAAELRAFYYTDSQATQAGEEFLSLFSLYRETHDIYNENHLHVLVADAIDGPTSEKIQIARTHLDANAEYLAKLREHIQTAPDLRYPLNFQQGAEMDYSAGKNVRIAVLVLLVSANLHAIDGNIEAAILDIGDAIRVAETLESAPVLVLQLIRSSCLSHIVSHVSYQINANVSSASLRKDLVSALDGLELNGMMAHGMMGELALGEYMKMKLNDRSTYSLPSWTAGFMQWRRRLPVEVWTANLFLSHSEAMQIGELPPWERYLASRRFHQRIEAEWFILHPFDQAMIPSSVRTYEAENRVLSLLEVTRTGLAVLDYAQAKGTLPERLDALVPEYLGEVPRDPFDGEPLRYRHTNTGYVVYSIAHDRSDNGGVAPAGDQKITEWGDLVFEVFDIARYFRQWDA